MSTPVALKQATVAETAERSRTHVRSTSIAHGILMSLASLKLTVVLFALAIFLVFASTLAQKEVDVWEVIHGWYRVDAHKLLNDQFPFFHTSQLFVRVPLQIFFPDTFFPHPPDMHGLGFYFPRGWLLGLFMAINLVAAHTVRFTVQSKGARLWGGVAVLALGVGVTILAVQSGASGDGILGESIIGWGLLWKLLLLGLAATAFGCIAAFFMLLPERRIEKALALTGALGCGGVLGYAIWYGAEAQISPESMRILWQLIKGTVAGLVLLAGCQMVFKKRAGIVLLHGGVGLMFLYEILVGTTHEEAQMPIVEGTKSNWVHDIRSVEFAVTERGTGDEERVTVVPQSLLTDGAELPFSELPFDAKVVKFYKNSSLRGRGPFEPAPATAGFGTKVAVEELKPVSGVDTGKNSDQSAMYVELIAKNGEKKSLGTYLVGVQPWHLSFLSPLLPPSADEVDQLIRTPQTFELDGKTYQVEMRYKRTYKPYTIEALEVRKDDYLAGDKPRNYSSYLRVVDPTRNIDRRESIKMNNPMRFAGETFYQSGFNKMGDKNITTIQVVRNDGWMLPYVSCMIVAVGMLVQFGATLSRFLSRRIAAANVAAAEQVAAHAEEKQKRKAAKKAAEERFTIESPLADASPIWSTRWLPVVGLLLVLTMIGYTAKSPTSKPEAMNFYEFGKLPVAYESRVKPFDSLARSTLSFLSHRQTYKENLDDPDERSKPATQWLLELVTDPDKADDRRVFRIDNLDAIKALGLTRNEHSRYSLKELRAQADTYDKLLTTLKKKQTGIEPFERELSKLSSRVQTYRLIQHAFFDPGLKMPSKAEYDKDREKVGRELVALRSKLEAVAAVSREMKEHNMEPPLAVPDGDKSWETYTDENLRLFLSSIQEEMNDASFEAKPAAAKLHAVFAAYKSGDVAAFNKSVADYREYLAATPPKEYDAGRRDLETYLNQADPFFWSSYLYLVAFVVACLAWFGWSKALNRTALAMIVAVFVYHTASLVLRMYVTERPPVTNLYSSAVFIGWAAVLLGIILELVYKIGVGNLMASIAGFGSLQIAYLLTRQGDTIEALEAVLDTQFWLTTHVVCITLGYATTFAAGLLGVVYLALGIGTKSLTPHVGKLLARMIYGSLCFALFFSFVGTVLGGLWADDSWGRFWGWDPKENGALIIVLWNALVLHARWDKMVGDRGLAVLAVAGNITTSWSWFGVNQLGVGLHSYGFSAELIALLFWFVVASAAVVTVGLIPKKYWFSTSAESA